MLVRETTASSIGGTARRRRGLRLVAPWGFYGWGNIGDEATLGGFARLVMSVGGDVSASVASRDPGHTSRVAPTLRHYRAVGFDPRRSLAVRRASAAVVPGGTPIMDVLGAWPLSELTPLIEAMHDRGLPVAFIGTGTERLVRETSRRIVAERLAPRVAHWSVRSVRDRERLVEYGVSPQRLTVATDLAWLLDGVDTAVGRAWLRRWGLDPGARVLGVNVNSERFVLEREPRLYEKMAQVLDGVIRARDLRVLFFCNEVRDGEGFDKVASERVRERMLRAAQSFIVPNHYWSPAQMLSLIGCCQATLGIRLHFCLFSALQRVPFVALQRSDKVADLCWDMGWQYGVELGELDAGRLEGMLLDAVDSRERLGVELDRVVERMRGKARHNTVPIEVLREWCTA